MAASWELVVPAAEKPNSQLQAKAVHSGVKALMPIKRKCFFRTAFKWKKYKQALNMCTKIVEIEANVGDAQKKAKIKKLNTKM